MITEDYVSFETAKLLKEKGFDEEYDVVYSEYGDLHKIFDKEFYENTNSFATISNSNYNDITRFKYGFFVVAPTLQMVMKWLREIYKLEVRITYDYDKDSWWGNINPMFEETDENSDSYQKALGFDYQGKSYEEACEATIKYYLENLI